ncbi:TPA: DUF4391 domain-containing protein [Streptococcus suis]
MSFLPSTQIPRPKVLYKPYQKGNKDFLDNFGLSTADKQLLRQQIGQITATHQLDAKTLPIPAGKTIQQIIVLRIDLLSQQLDPHLLAELDTYLGFYTLFHLVFPDGTSQYLIHYKEKLAQSREGRNFKIVRHFQTDKPLALTYQERDLDQFYENLVKQAGAEELVGGGATIKDQIEQTERLAAMEKKAAQLKKKMFAEKAMRKQMELRKAYKALEEEIQQLRTSIHSSAPSSKASF